MYLLAVITENGCRLKVVGITEQKRYIEKDSQQFCSRSADGPFGQILGKTQKIFIRH